MRLTAKDSASVLLQISFSYQLVPEHLASLYKEHGFNWKSSIQTNSRSLLRNEGAKYEALQYVKDSVRVSIESAFATVLENYFNDGVVKGVPAIKMVGFYLLGVDFEKTNGKDKNEEINKSDLKKDLNELTNAGLSLSAASKYLAKKYGIKKSIIYNLK